MAEDQVVDYVRASSVRTAVLRAVLEDPRETRALVDDLAASESGVYAAVDDLADRRLVDDDGGTVRPTGLGLVVGSCLDRLSGAHAVMDADREYWARHDPSVLPAPYRRFDVFEGATVLRADDHDPHAVTREVASLVEGASRLRSVAPVYHERIAEAVETVDDTRFVLDRDTVARRVDDPSDRSWTDDTVRLASVSYALSVTEERVLLSLPLLDGSYDERTELVAESDAAVTWAEDCFDYVWDRATPLSAAFDAARASHSQHRDATKR